MAESLISHDLKLTSGNSAGTQYDFILAGGVDTRTLTQMLVLQNNSGSAQTITAKFQRYAGSWADLFTKTYAVPAGESEVLSELIGAALEGQETNPDKISIAFSETLTGAETIDCIGTSVLFF